MFGSAGRRIAETLVALFALLGFAFVPLGQKTAFQHACAIFTTPAALGAFRELTNAVDRLRVKVVGALVPGTPGQPTEGPKPELPELPRKAPGRR